MGMDSAKFLEVQKRARKIMDMDRNGQLDKYSSQKGDLLENGDIDFGTTNTLQYNQIPSAMMAQTSQMPLNVADKKIPKEILESFKTTQIGDNMNMQQTSVLDAIGVPQQPIIQNKRTQILKENVEPTASQNIDYSLIKTIVEDCMRKSLATLKKNILTENKNGSDDSLALMKIGENFKFVTSSGDIYEAKLIKKGNVNEIKKSNK